MHVQATETKMSIVDWKSYDKYENLSIELCELFALFKHFYQIFLVLYMDYIWNMFKSALAFTPILEGIDEFIYLNIYNSLSKLVFLFGVGWQ